MKTTINDLKAKSTLNRMSIERLVELWEETEKHFTTAELFRVRGWLMDVLESKNPIAFDKWISAEHKTPVDDMPRTYFLVA